MREVVLSDDMGEEKLWKTRNPEGWGRRERQQREGYDHVCSESYMNI